MFCVILLGNLTSGCHIYSQDSNRGRIDCGARDVLGAVDTQRLAICTRQNQKGSLGRKAAASASP